MSHALCATFCEMLNLGHLPSHSTLCKTLTACARLGPPLGLLLGTQIHALLAKTHSPSSTSLSNSLISMYGSTSAALPSALSLFRLTPFKTVVSWNSVISAFSNSGDTPSAFSLFSSMLRQPLRPTPYTLAALVASASSPLLLLQLLSAVLKSGTLLDLFVGSAMVAALARAGLPGSALHILRRMSCRNAVSLNGLMAGMVGRAEGGAAVAVFVELARSIDLSPDSYAVLLTAVRAGGERGGRWAGQVHAFVLTAGLFSASDSGIRNGLVQCYSQLGLVHSALAVFHLIQEKDLSSWNSIISCLDQNGRPEAAAGAYSAMRVAGLPPSKHSLISSLASCSAMAWPSLGRQVHCEGLKTGLTADTSVSNSLIRLYALCGGLRASFVVFSSMAEKDVVSWNSMVGASGGRSAELLVEMMREGWRPNRVTFITILSVVSRLELHQLGVQLHAMAVKYSLSHLTPISNAMLSLYGRCCSLPECERVFSRMGPAKDDASFNSMVSGYVRSGEAEKAMGLARSMVAAGRLDRFAFATVLSACASAAALDRGMQAHGCYVRRWGGRGEEDVVVGSAAVDMYGKCGRMEYAARVFDGMRVRNLCSWNSVICGYARHGRAAEALRAFDAMAGEEEPDEVTFVGVLSACGHAGMVREGLRRLRSMTERYSLSPRVEHFSCVVDLLARSGELERVEEFIEGMPVEGNALIWRSVLGACCRAKGRHLELGRRAGRMLMEMEPEKAANYVLLANMYAAGGRWDGAAEAWGLMREAGVRKEAGCSWVHARDGVHVFSAGDRSHPEMESIYRKLQELGGRLKDEGYVALTEGVGYDVEMENKEEALRYHSERLALAFALTRESSMDIRIMKNLRVCDDCHSVLRHASKIVGRRIVLRDSNRFHHFVHGECSCQDYW